MRPVASGSASSTKAARSGAAALRPSPPTIESVQSCKSKHSVCCRPKRAQPSGGSAGSSNWKWIPCQDNLPPTTLIIRRRKSASSTAGRKTITGRNPSAARMARVGRARSKGCSLQLAGETQFDGLQIGQLRGQSAGGGERRRYPSARGRRLASRRHDQPSHVPRRRRLQLAAGGIGRSLVAAGRSWAVRGRNRRTGRRAGLGGRLGFTATPRPGLPGESSPSLPDRRPAPPEASAAEGNRRLLAFRPRLPG